MQFLKLLLLVLGAGLAVAFAINNWTSVPLALWGGLIADINLPLLMLLCFGAGLLPTWAALATTRWRLRTRLATAERAVADLRAAVPPPPPIVADPPLVPQPPVTGGETA